MGDQSGRNSRWTVPHWMSKVRTGQRRHDCVLISHGNADEMILGGRELGRHCELFQGKEPPSVSCCGDGGTAQAVVQLLLTACHLLPRLVALGFLRTGLLKPFWLFYPTHNSVVRQNNNEHGKFRNECVWTCFTPPGCRGLCD